MSTSPDTTAVASLQFPEFFTQSYPVDVHPYDQIQWGIRDAIIMDKDGNVVFEQREVEFPDFWSQTATNVVASKYFRGTLGAPDREWSVRQMIDRVVNTITDWGVSDGYFDIEHSEIFAKELTYLLVNQYGSFNSPVWFNLGVKDTNTQVSACFILSVEDSMPGILEWYRQEGMIFSRGSGAGVNVSSLRAKGEPISKGGTSSGPLSFMRAADASAFSIKSGGTTRRSARMVVMNADHPDIMEFIQSKGREEEKARALALAGFDDSLDGEIYATVAHQNCNMSVRLTDAFMRAVEEDGDWQTYYVSTGEKAKVYKAREVFRAIAEGTWNSGDPGVQFDTTMNNWNPVINDGRFEATNPCSEYVFLNNTACNLASINLLSFLDDNGHFDTQAFQHAVNLFITAQEIMVSRASYPTPAIEKNSHVYRTLGLGYANLGAVLMAKGLPYDSAEGRAYAASITALMTGRAYAQSAEMSRVKGPFAGFEANRETMVEGVIIKHMGAIESISNDRVADFPDIPKELLLDVWKEAYFFGNIQGFRNAQVSLLAPCGTISFMMDCTTTGVEPDTSLVSYKKLVGGGTLKHINTVVPRALDVLGYNGQSQDICQHIATHGTIEGAPHLAPHHLPIFDCAFPSTQNGRSIGWEGHVRMVAAVQPFLSGGISKTINMPNNSTVEDIENAYMLGWRLGCKSMAIYRDGCKQTQPVTTHNTENAIKMIKEHYSTPTPLPQRRRLPDERQAITHKATVGGHEFYVTVGLYENGSPGEIFLHMAKEGSTISGLMDGFATAISMALQYGVPLEALVTKFSHMRFEPAGFTKNTDIPIAKSIFDYLFRWLGAKFVEKQSPRDNEVITTLDEMDGDDHYGEIDAVLCMECGSMMTINGSCHKCMNCGGTSGCS